MKRIFYAISMIMIGTCLFVGDINAQNKKDSRQSETAVNALLKDYSNTSQKVAKEMIDKYGQPNEATASMLIWHNNGPWKTTILHSDEVQHHFPMPHTDVLEQTINMDVDPSKYDKLGMYDGSVVVKRTEGEMSARCDKEPMNMLALNLAYDIIEGKKTVEQAREYYVQAAMRFMKGDKDSYTQKLIFSPDNVAGYKDMPAKMEGMK